MADMKKLAKDISNSLKVMTDAFSKLELAHAKETAMKLLKVVVKGSKYVEDFVKKGDISRTRGMERYIGRIKQFGATQFRKKLDDFQDDLRDRRLKFREAALVDVLVNNHVMSE